MEYYLADEKEVCLCVSSREGAHYVLYYKEIGQRNSLYNSICILK